MATPGDAAPSTSVELDHLCEQLTALRPAVKPPAGITGADGTGSGVVRRQVGMMTR